MENVQRGCVYFFRHIGLSPVKIGYSNSESPIKRFESFKTYAPYGSEIIGFIITMEAKELETLLHQKFGSKRLKGEWFEITEEEAQKEIDFYTSISDIEVRNNFQISWAKSLHDKKIELFETVDSFNKVKTFERFEKMYFLNSNLNRTQASIILEVSRQTIQNWIVLLNKKYCN